ncbi:uncharacterized protein LOC130793041 [Actinidia eriantha]|uniref:uncharacterized protein LOC130793041 n=1 Tax=Actinidia eriantha TaxID=165200 RepID=UPI002590B4AC|nr:uncharacterized protein LOC130793041 [Actinidia eriantha]
MRLSLDCTLSLQCGTTRTQTQKTRLLQPCLTWDFWITFFAFFLEVKYSKKSFASLLLRRTEPRSCTSCFICEKTSLAVAHISSSFRRPSNARSKRHLFDPFFFAFMGKYVLGMGQLKQIVNTIMQVLKAI